jgi:hypothetical protein
MAVTSKYYGLGLKSLVDLAVSGSGASVLTAMLVDSTYTPDQDTHQYIDDVTGFTTPSPEASVFGGTGYSEGGLALTISTAYDVGSNTLTVSATANPSWATSTFTCHYLIFFLNTGTPSTSPLVSYVDFDTDQSPVAQTFEYQIPGTGIAQFVAA